VSPTVLTIGHSTQPLERLVALLVRHGVTAVADVRSQPYSRYSPDFNKESLEPALKANGVAYVFLGRELGARPDDRSLYDEGRVSWERLRASALFQAGLDRVVDGAVRVSIALLCAEKDPLECHRTLLVGRALEERGVAIAHIHADGRLETSDEAMSRLLAMFKMPEADLFRGRDELVAEACDRQAKRITFVDPNAAWPEATA
jgi:uncharacterized protein (DUF488 family)